MTATTKRYNSKKQQDPAKAEQAAAKATAFREMAKMLDGELKAGKHTERLKKATREVEGLERYSPLNQLIILTQRPDVTEVHGYAEWQGLGFQVRKGEKALAIRAPHTRPAGEGEGAGTLGFHRAYVFDRSQVDPIIQDTATTSVVEGNDQDAPEAEAIATAEMVAD